MKKKMPAQQQIAMIPSKSTPNEGQLDGFLDAFTRVLSLSDDLRDKVKYDAETEKMFRRLRGHCNRLWQLHDLSMNPANDNKVLDGVQAAVTATLKDLAPIHALQVPTHLTAMSAPLLLPASTFARAPILELPVDEVLYVLEWLLREVQRLWQNTPVAERGKLRDLITFLQMLISWLRTFGSRIPAGMLEPWIQKIVELLRSTQAGRELLARFFMRMITLMRTAGVLGGGGAAGGAAGGAGLGAILLGFIQCLIALGLGALVGWLISKIPVGDGENVGDVLEDGFYGAYMYFSGRFDCEDFYRMWQRFRARRRWLQEDVGESVHLLPYLSTEMYFLEQYLKCHKPVFAPLVNELKRLKALRERIESNPV